MKSHSLTGATSLTCSGGKDIVGKARSVDAQPTLEEPHFEEHWAEEHSASQLCTLSAFIEYLCPHPHPDFSPESLLRDSGMEKFIVGVTEDQWAYRLAKSDAQYVLNQMLTYMREGVEELYQGNRGPDCDWGGLGVNHRRRRRLRETFSQAGLNHTVRKITSTTDANRFRKFDDDSCDSDECQFNGSCNQRSVELIHFNRVQVSCMKHVDLITDYVNDFVTDSREYKEPEKVLKSLQHLLLLSGYGKVHTGNGKGKCKGKRRGKGTDAGSNDAHTDNGEGANGGSDDGDDNAGADNADEANAEAQAAPERAAAALAEEWPDRHDCLQDIGRPRSRSRINRSSRSRQRQSRFFKKTQETDSDT
jgi:hypothetical protein